ncbi:MAG TPA: hypothetical protein VF045_09515, partial [Acidimicrobiales bacterium]
MSHAPGSSAATDRPPEPATGVPPDGTDPGPPAPSWRPFPTLVRGLLRYLAVALVGVVLVLAGLIWDAVVHAQ